ncbi:MAG TPA: hypothetical protein VGF95_15700 [Solirubrobacteraceae bacterium]|jgi:hypothetical protein
MRPEKSYGIHHRVTLPDGREVEVVYLDRASGEAQMLSDAGRRDACGHADGDGESSSGGIAGELGGHLAEELGLDASGLLDAPPLHVCFHCDGELVHPVDWVDEGAGSWRILLRCPECEATREGVFDRIEVDSFEEELDHGMGSLLSDLRRMTHTNMSEEIDFFVRALQADVILPSDF